MFIKAKKNLILKRSDSEVDNIKTSCLYDALGTAGLPWFFNTMSL